MTLAFPIYLIMVAVGLYFGAGVDLKTTIADLVFFAMGWLAGYYSTPSRGKRDQQKPNKKEPDKKENK